MPRRPVQGLLAIVFCFLWGVLGLALAGWAVAQWTQPEQGYEAAMWLLQGSPVKLPWDHERVIGFLTEHTVAAAIVGILALLNSVSLARRARLHFRPLTESNDGKGEIAFKGMEQRVGRPLEGTIKLHDAPAPGQEYTLRLRAKKHAGGTHGYEAKQTALARQGVHGMSLPFRFEIPATAPATGATWLLDFGPRERKFFRSEFEVKLGEAPESEIRRASAHEGEDHEEPVAQAAAPTWGTSSSASLPPEASAQPTMFQTQRNRELFDHIEKLANAFGKKFTPQERERLMAQASSQQLAGMRDKLEAVKKIKPEHAKFIKYAVIGFVLLFFVLPWALSILGVILAAIFGR